LTGASCPDACGDGVCKLRVLAEARDVAGSAIRDAAHGRQSASTLVSKFVLISLHLLESMEKHTAHAGKSEGSWAATITAAPMIEAMIEVFIFVEELEVEIDDNGSGDK